jgi:hypothetical protein
MASSKALAPKSTDAELSLDQVQDVLLNNAALAVVDTGDIQDDMVRRILSAESAQDAFSEFTSVPARDIEGLPIDVIGVAWMRSAFKDGPGVYALLRCVMRDNGDKIVVSMGGRTTMASFLWAQRNEAMPIAGVFKQSRSNSDPEKSYWTFALLD